MVREIPTILLVYNRPNHTRLVLNALRDNSECPDHLFIFHDGIKDDTNIEDWKKVEEIIRNVDFCPVSVITDDSNKGLANSVKESINFVLKKYDAFVVLEDDCVPAEGFMSFMRQCLVEYEKTENVYCVSGYSWSINIEDSVSDVYMSGRESSWGWGSWKLKWCDYKEDYSVIRRIKQSQSMSRELAVWGNDLEQMLVEQMLGNIDSWAVFWALNIILHKGVCVMPRHSLIKNIGFDGTGVHCQKNGLFEVNVTDGYKIKYKLLTDTCIKKEIEYGFYERFPLLSNSTAINDGHNKEEILVYGVGEYFKRNEDLLNEQYYISGFIDKKKKGYFAGKRIISPQSLKVSGNERVVIMIENRNICAEVKHVLMESGIKDSNILIWAECFDKDKVCSHE